MKIEFDRTKVTEREAQIIEAIGVLALTQRASIAIVGNVGPPTPEDEQASARFAESLLRKCFPDLDVRVTMAP